jgi:hypothetical protein
MKAHYWKGDDIAPVEFTGLDTVHVHIRVDANGGWYYPVSNGLYNGPHPDPDICCLEYFRIKYAEKTGKIYMSSKASYDVKAVLAGEVKREAKQT